MRSKSHVFDEMFKAKEHQRKAEYRKKQREKILTGKKFKQKKQN